MTKVSVCIPTYNNLELFKKCLNSVLVQEFKDYEIIVSDDSSNDEIKNYLNKLNHLNIKYIHNSPSLGSPQNWNKAVSEATGNYIKILHHDDYFTDKSGLAKFVDAFKQNPKADFVFCYAKIHFKADDSIYINKQTKPQLKRLKENVNFLFFRNVIGAPSAVCFKNDKSILFNNNYKWLVDVDFYIRYLSKHKEFVSIPESLITVLDGAAEQITHNITKDKGRIVTENLNLFSEIFNRKLNNKKSWLYFQELFENYDIASLDELKAMVSIPENLNDFLIAVFLDWHKNKLVKKIKKRLLTSRYNKRIFKIERF
jgi:glycosyltransferase involved in cell wall biosynthesis